MKTVPFDHMTMTNMMIPERRPTDELLDDLKPLYREIMDRIIQAQQTN